MPALACVPIAAWDSALVQPMAHIGLVHCKIVYSVSTVYIKEMCNIGHYCKSVQLNEYSIFSYLFVCL